MLENNRRMIEIPFQNVYMPEFYDRVGWVGEDGNISINDDGTRTISFDDMPIDPPIEIATKLLTKTIECQAEVLHIDEIKSKDTIDSCFINIGNIRISSEINNKRLVNTMKFEQETIYKDFRCVLCQYWTVEVEIDKKDRDKIEKGINVYFTLVETPKNLKFMSYDDDGRPIKKFEYNQQYQTLILKYDYKCLGIEYIKG